MEAMLQSPHFLYRFELGVANSGRNARSPQETTRFVDAVVWEGDARNFYRHPIH